MIDWIIIAFLILSGIGLIIIEIIFVPGTTIVGVFGFSLGIYGLYRCYDLYGTETGHYVFAASAILTLVASVLSFKSNAWKRFANAATIESKVNESLTVNLSVGMEGTTVSSLKPVGKVDFSDKEYEATTLGNFIEEKKAVKIIKIDRNKIIVEPIT